MKITHSYKGLSKAYSKARKGTPKFAAFMISRAGLEKIHINRILSIVELGAGSGQQTEFVEKELQALGITHYKILAYDKSSDQLDLLKERMKAGELSNKVIPLRFDFDGNPLPVESGSIDLVYMAWVLHHLKNQQFVINETARILRKGAMLFMYQVTIEALENHPLDKYFPMKFEYDQTRYPTYTQLKQMLRHAGFTYEKPYAIKKDDPKPIDRAFLEGIENTSFDSALKMIKDNDPLAFTEGVKRVREEVEKAESTGTYHIYSHDRRKIFWGIKNR